MSALPQISSPPMVAETPEDPTGWGSFSRPNLLGPSGINPNPTKEGSVNV